jgi:hypothetical protein
MINLGNIVILMSRLGINTVTTPSLHFVEALRPNGTDIAGYEEDAMLGTGSQGIMVIKRTNQNERDAFIRNQMQQTGSDAQTVIRGDVNTNQYYNGMVTSTELGVRRLAPDTARQQSVLLQPTAAAYDRVTDSILIGAANSIKRLSPDLQPKGEVNHPWFGRLHTIDMIPGTREALVTSASMDMLHIINADSGELVSEFSLWDRFPCYNQQGQLVVRQGVQPDFNISEPESNIVRVAPDGLGLHHSRLPLHINSAIMAEPGKVLFTAFKTGTLYEYDLNTGFLTPVLDGMGAPHLIIRAGEGFMVTDTIGETVVNLRRDYSVASSFRFSSLGGKKPGLEGERWLQSAMPLNNGLVAAVDSPRSSLHLIDPVAKTRRSIPFDNNWAVQTFLPLGN